MIQTVIADAAVLDYERRVEDTDLVCRELRALLKVETDAPRRTILDGRLKARRNWLLRGDQLYARLRAAAYDARQETVKWPLP